jgi:hypothetical protein
MESLPSSAESNEKEAHRSDQPSPRSRGTTAWEASDESQASMQCRCRNGQCPNAKRQALLDLHQLLVLQALLRMLQIKNVIRQSRSFPSGEGTDRTFGWGNSTID